MRLLVLGGTRFVGRAVVDSALEAGHDVTLFNRGRTNPGLYPQVESVVGDRTADLSPLDGRHFDAVVDCAGYHPDVVRLSVGKRLADRYIFVSSCSVYADQSVPPVEGAAMLDDDSYGGRKAACEQVVLDGYRDQALIARPGMITGPHDPTERLAYWPRRLARGGRVLAPGDPAAPVQFIDVRDLARWLVTTPANGVFNTVGPMTSMAAVLDACRQGNPAELVWVPDEVLLREGVDPWMGVPMWIADPQWSAANEVDGTKAWAAGLVNRPIAETIADICECCRGEEPLSEAEESRLLDASR